MHDRHSSTSGHAAQAAAAAVQRAKLEFQVKLIDDNSCKFHALAKFLSFDDETAFDRALGRSGKSPYCLDKAPGGAPRAQHAAHKVPVEHVRKIKMAIANRKAMVEKARKEKEHLMPSEVMEQLRQVFDAYSDKLLFMDTGRREINILGFCRLLRDCRLLDNRLTLVGADVVFTQVDASHDASSIAHDLSLDWDEFLAALQRLLRIKFPGGSAGAKAEDMMVLLARNWLLPFHRGYQAVRSVDALFSRTSLNLMRRYDKQFKRLFAWYASLPETEPSHVQWEHVRNTNATLGSGEFVLLAHNFQITPALASKHEVIDIFESAESENDGDGEADAVLYPTFLETFMNLATSVADTAETRIPECAGSEELRTFKRYVAGCPAPLGPRLALLLRERLALTGRDFSDGPPPARSYDNQIRALNERVALVHQQEMLYNSFNTVLRREDVRQKFALTRLKNYYRDVRTGRNQGVWVPDQPTATTGSLRDTGRSQFDCASSDGLSNNLVAFFSDSRQIKPPRVQQLTGPTTTTTLDVLPSPKSWALPSNDGTVTKEELIQNSEQFRAFLRSPGRSQSSPGRGAQPRSPRIYKLAPLEDVEESESILQLVKTLPSIGGATTHSVSSDGGSTGGMAAQADDGTSSTGGASDRASPRGGGTHMAAAHRSRGPSPSGRMDGGRDVAVAGEMVSTGGRSKGCKLPPLGRAQTTRLLRPSLSHKPYHGHHRGGAMMGSGAAHGRWRPHSVDHLQTVDPDWLQVQHLSD